MFVRFVKSLCLLVGLVAMLNPVFGCTQSPPTPPPAWIVSTGWVQPYPCGPKYQSVWIIFHNFSTFGSGLGQNCACAFRLGGPVASVIGASLLYANTFIPVPGFNFCINPATTNSAAIFGRGAFKGFWTRLSQNVPAGIACDLMVCVLLKQGTTVASLANFLKTSGTVLLTGEADDSGNFIGGEHFDELGVSGTDEGSIEIVHAPPKNRDEPVDRFADEEDVNKEN